MIPTTARSSGVSERAYAQPERVLDRLVVLESEPLRFERKLMPQKHPPAATRRITVGHPALVGNEAAYVHECFKSEWISAGGPFVDRFEDAFARLIECEFAIATNSGTSALHLALVALGIGPGDEVIVPTMTFVATVNTVAYCRATPVFVDSVRPSLGMDVRQVEAAITHRTKAILPVHLYGHPADIGPLLLLGRRYGIPIVEDAAEALGAKYHGRPVGALGTCGAFSFFGNKMITTGQGGMVTTNDSDLAQRMCVYREQGRDPRRHYWASLIGYNYRMTNIEAAIGLAQLEKIDFHVSARASVALWYAEQLADLQDVIQLPVAEPGNEHSFWMYAIEFRASSGIDRDAVIAGLAERKIETRPAFYPVHTMPPYYRPDLSFPIAEEFSRNGLCLPTHALISEDDVRYVVEQLREVIADPHSRSRAELRPPAVVGISTGINVSRPT